MWNLQVNALKVAKFFATVKHGGQLYGGIPYTHHLAAVEAVARRFEDDIKNGIAKDLVYIAPVADRYEALVVATWLHDAVEDTGTKLKEIEEMFGGAVASLVHGVTNEKGENRKVRAALTYPKIRGVVGAVALKLADRIANVENGGKLVEMYQKEYEDFKRALYSPGVYEEMWKHLDKLLEVVS
jgi:(p)ppGpp synthase/HD superfamily hydrolase